MFNFCKYLQIISHFLYLPLFMALPGPSICRYPGTTPSGPGRAHYAKMRACCSIRSRAMLTTIFGNKMIFWLLILVRGGFKVNMFNFCKYLQIISHFLYFPLFMAMPGPSIYREAGITPYGPGRAHFLKMGKSFSIRSRAMITTIFSTRSMCWLLI